MSYQNALRRSQRRAVVAGLIAFWVAVVGSESVALGGGVGSTAHGHHASVAHAADMSPVAIAVEHPHASRGDLPLSPESFADAVLPRGGVSLLLLALITGLIGVPLLWRQRAESTPRGPPRTRTHTLGGRDVLARLCIARR